MKNTAELWDIVFICVTVMCPCWFICAHRSSCRSHDKSLLCQLCSPHHREKWACPLPHGPHFRPRSSWLSSCLALCPGDPAGALRLQCLTLSTGRPRTLSRGFWGESRVLLPRLRVETVLGPRPPDTACSGGEQPLECVVVKCLPCKGA